MQLDEQMRGSLRTGTHLNRTEDPENEGVEDDQQTRSNAECNIDAQVHGDIGIAARALVRLQTVSVRSRMLRRWTTHFAPVLQPP